LDVLDFVLKCVVLLSSSYTCAGVIKVLDPCSWRLSLDKFPDNFLDIDSTHDFVIKDLFL